jgi:hypothetical protein
MSDSTKGRAPKYAWRQNKEREASLLRKGPRLTPAERLELESIERWLRDHDEPTPRSAR